MAGLRASQLGTYAAIAVMCMLLAPSGMCQLKLESLMHSFDCAHFNWRGHAVAQDQPKKLPPEPDTLRVRGRLLPFSFSSMLCRAVRATMHICVQLFQL